jgi:acetolactate synthase-1/2/3 large subunit
VVSSISQQPLTAQNLSAPLAPMRRTGAYALIDSLVQHGVQHILGNPGEAILTNYKDL